MLQLVHPLKFFWINLWDFISLSMHFLYDHAMPCVLNAIFEALIEFILSYVSEFLGVPLGNIINN